MNTSLRVDLEAILFQLLLFRHSIVDTLDIDYFYKQREIHTSLNVYAVSLYSKSSNVFILGSSVFVYYIEAYY